jgi:hypothetical protein
LVPPGVYVRRVDVSSTGIGPRCIKITVKRLRLGCGAPPLGQRQNPHHPDLPALGKGQHIAHHNAMTRLFATLGIQAKMASFHTVLRQITRFKEPGVKQPLVQPEFRLDAGINFARRPRQSELALKRHQRGKGIVRINRLFNARRAGLEGLLPIVAVRLAAFAVAAAITASIMT